MVKSKQSPENDAQLAECERYETEFKNLMIDFIRPSPEECTISEYTKNYEYTADPESLPFQYNFVNELKYLYLMNTIKQVPTNCISDLGVSVNPRETNTQYRELGPKAGCMEEIRGLDKFAQDFKTHANINQAKVDKLSERFPPINKNRALDFNPFIRHLHMVLVLGTSRSSASSLRNSYLTNGVIDSEDKASQRILEMFNNKKCLKRFKEHAGLLDKVFKYFSYIVASHIIAEKYYKLSESGDMFHKIQPIALDASTEPLPVKAGNLMAMYSKYLPPEYNFNNVRTVLNKTVKMVDQTIIDYERPRFIKNEHAWSYNLFDIGQVPNDLNGLNTEQQKLYDLLEAYVDLLVNNEYEDKKVMLTALKHTFDKPNVKLMNRLWITGSQGVGKSAFCSLISMAWGNTKFAFGRESENVNKSNWSISDCNHIYRYWDELDPKKTNYSGKQLSDMEKIAYMGQFIEQTKSEITDSQIISNKKGSSIGERQSSKFYICCSNSIQYVRLTGNDRRRELPISFGVSDDYEEKIFMDKLKKYQHLFPDFEYDHGKSPNENLTIISAHICSIFQPREYRKGATNSNDLNNKQHDMLAEVVRYFFKHNGDKISTEQIDGRMTNLKCYTIIDSELKDEIDEITEKLNGSALYYHYSDAKLKPTYNSSTLIYGKSFRNTFRNLHENKVSMNSHEAVRMLKKELSLVDSKVFDNATANEIFKSAHEKSDLSNIQDHDDVINELRSKLSINSLVYIKEYDGASKKECRELALIEYFNQIAKELEFIDENRVKFHEKFIDGRMNKNYQISTFLNENGFYSGNSKSKRYININL